MGDAAKQKNLDQNVPLKDKVQDYYKVVDDIKVGMLTTKTDMASRPMYLAKRNGPTLYVVTNKDSHKIEELKQDAKVNFAFYNNTNKDYVSVSGDSKLLNDDKLVKELYRPELKAWFGDKGDGKHDGSINDPRIGVLVIEPLHIVYSIQDRPKAAVTAAIAKAKATGDIAKVSNIREINHDEIETAKKEKF